MSQRTLTLTFVVVACFLVAGNLLLKPWSKRLPYRQKLEDIRLATAPNMLFIGNSLLDGRVDAPALKQGIGAQGDSIKPLNAALGGSDPHVQALLTDYATRCHPELQTLVIGFFDFQLTNEEQLTPEDLTGNAGVGLDSRFPLPEVVSVYHLNHLEELEVRFLRIAPMIAYRKNAWKYVELMRRDMGQMGMPHAHAATNVNGRAADFSALEAGTPEHFDQEAQKYLKDSSHFSSSYERIFAVAAAHRMRVVVVVMPMSPVHRKTYYSRASWSQYLTLEEQHLRDRGYEVIDASNWMPDREDFVDNLHMSPEGATKFSTQVGRELGQMKGQ